MGFFTNLFGKKSDLNKEETENKDTTNVAPEIPVTPVESTPEEENSETSVISDETSDTEKEKINE